MSVRTYRVYGQHNGHTKYYKLHYKYKISPNCNIATCTFHAGMFTQIDLWTNQQNKEILTNVIDNIRFSKVWRESYDALITQTTIVL